MYFIDDRIIKLFVGLLCFFIGAAIGDTLESTGHSKLEILSYGLIFLGAFMPAFMLGGYVKGRRKK